MTFICEITKSELSSWQPSERTYKEIMSRRKNARKAVEAAREARDVLDTHPERLLREAGKQLDALAELPAPPEPEIGRVYKLLPGSQIAGELHASRKALTAQVVSASPAPALPAGNSAVVPLSARRPKPLAALPPVVAPPADVSEIVEIAPEIDAAAERTAQNRQTGRDILMTLDQPVPARKSTREEVLAAMFAEDDQPPAEAEPTDAEIRIIMKNARRNRRADDDD